MQMDGWQDRLHISFLGEHVLFGALRLDSLSSFFLASLLTACFCLSERLLTFALSKHWNPFGLRSRSGIALWRTCLYWFVTLDRLIYMLAAMTFHLGIIVVTVTALSSGQFVIEYIDTPHPSSTRSLLKRPHLLNTSQESEHTKEPLLGSSHLEDEDVSPSTYAQYPPSLDRFSLKWQQPQVLPNESIQTESATREPRTKSKPDEIFIHPARSNIFRAEALAIQAGLTVGGTELVDSKSYMYPPSPGIQDQRQERGWGGGNGRDTVRKLLLGEGRVDTKNENGAR